MEIFVKIISINQNVDFEKIKSTKVKKYYKSIILITKIILIQVNVGLKHQKNVHYNTIISF